MSMRTWSGIFDSLDTEEATAVADYLSRMRGPIQDHERMNGDGTTNN